ncbi:MAG: diadenylate cyclase CdaA [Bacteroidales bacterium]|nr:diadenylate cyclase CdaA [Bacteroidales bacterium]
MTNLFITVRLLDVIDILLMAFILYQLFLLIKGTVAINIFVGIFSVYLLWLIVKALNMQLLGLLLGQFIGVGVIALIIVFQQELRRFLLMIGTRYLFTRKFSFENLFKLNLEITSNTNINSIVTACSNLSETKTGALIVISTKSELRSYVETGEILNAYISNSLLENIFFKNSPLHDGAVVIVGNKIKAARCILPISDEVKLPIRLGMRHRAALSMSNATDAIIIVVSEETGKIAFAKSNKLTTRISTKKLTEILENELGG